MLVDPLATATGRCELAWLAAERAYAAALLSEDAALIGAAHVLRGFALMKLGLKPRERALAIWRGRRTGRRSEQPDVEAIPPDGVAHVRRQGVGSGTRPASGGRPSLPPR
jgi:hypothetical protein